MTDDMAVWRAARILVMEHGADATVKAAMRADELLDAGDLDGQAVWKRILRATEILLAASPSEGGAVH